MDHLSPLGWAVIIVLAVFFIILNAGLFNLLRNRSQFDELSRRLNAPKSAKATQALLRAKEVLQDPFKEERHQLNELSRLVSTLKEPALSGSENPDLPKDQPHSS